MSYDKKELVSFIMNAIDIAFVEQVEFPVNHRITSSDTEGQRENIRRITMLDGKQVVINVTVSIEDA